MERTGHEITTEACLRNHEQNKTANGGTVENVVSVLHGDSAGN